jgi:flagellar assembly factor FliW
MSTTDQTIATSAWPSDASNSHAGDATIVFAEGLVGCPDWQRFVLLVDEEEELPVAILQSLDSPSVQLLVTDPTLIDPAFPTHLSDKDRAEIGLSAVADPVVYCTLTLGGDGSILAPSCCP